MRVFVTAPGDRGRSLSDSNPEWSKTMRDLKPTSTPFKGREGARESRAYFFFAAR